MMKLGLLSVILVMLAVGEVGGLTAKRVHLRIQCDGFSLFPSAELPQQSVAGRGPLRKRMSCFSTF